MYKTGKYILHKEHMNLRKEPKINSQILGVIPEQTCITVTDVYDNWGKTEYSGINGWCCISECFAKSICEKDCEKCCYYEKYKIIKKAAEELYICAENLHSLIENNYRVGD